MRVIIGCDHAAVPQKDEVVAMVRAAGHEVVDKGTHGTDRVDYPDVAEAVAVEVAQAEATPRSTVGVLLCGSGIGMSIAANKVRGIRAALVHDAYTARMCRQHNDANVLCLGARTSGIEIIKEAVATFLSTDFEGGRHADRVGKISSLDAKNC